MEFVLYENKAHTIETPAEYQPAVGLLFEPDADDPDRWDNLLLV
jgi:hypothetical protein